MAVRRSSHVLIRNALFVRGFACGAEHDNHHFSLVTGILQLNCSRISRWMYPPKRYLVVSDHTP